jgi:PAS domain S-box-containing protein
VESQDFSRFFHLSLDLLCIADTDGYFRQVNPAFESVLGFTIEDLLSTPFIDLVHPDDRQLTTDEIGHLASGIPTINFENRYRTKDGNYRWLAWSSAPSDDGLLYAVARDITEERQRVQEMRDLLASYKAAEELRQSTSDQLKLTDAQIGVVLDAAADGFLLTGPNREIIWANPALRKMFGLGEMDLIGRASTDLQPVVGPRVANSGGFYKRLDSIYEDHSLVVEEETLEIVQPEPATLSRSTVPVLTAENEYIGRLWIYRDVTKRLAAERVASEFAAKNRSLQEMNVTKALFISTISHELRTPLTSILAFSELLQRSKTVASSERDVKHLNAILRSGERLKALINDLLDLSEIESDVMRIRASIFMLDEVVRGVTETVGPMLERKSQRILTSEFDSTVNLMSDRERFEQILINLISNASKYSDHGTEIRIDVVTDPTHLRISVIDKGEGIDSGQFESIFEAFGRVDNEVTRSNQGSGLGLAISRRLARAMGGDVEVESAPGVGSRFTVVLPRTLPETDAA